MLFNPRIEIGRDEHETSDCDAGRSLEVMSNARAAVTAITFADQVLFGLETAIFHKPVINDAGKVFDVRCSGVEEPFCFGWRDKRARKASANRINKNEIGKRQPRSGIIEQAGRVGGAVAAVRKLRSEEHT